jgi:hypothetical protein
MAGYDRWRGPDAAQFLVGIHDGEELFVVWCKKEQDSLYNEIERLESGRLRTYPHRASKIWSEPHSSAACSPQNSRHMANQAH